MTGLPPDLHGQLACHVRALDKRMAALARQLYDRPELAYAEHHAVAALRDCLAEHGVRAEVGAYGLPTALRASAGRGGPRVALLAEYDALPGIGHACGHNLVAAASVAAFLALRRAVGLLGGTVELIGTPAEESGGGKQRIIDAGGFDGVDAALMVHPSHEDQAYTWHTGRRLLAVTYHGRAAHGASAGRDGGALDAVVAGYQALARLREGLGPGGTVSGVITDGGTAPTVVPARASAEFCVRSATLDGLHGLHGLSGRVEEALRAAAHATGTEAEIRWDTDPPYLPTLVNSALAEAFVASADDGRVFPSHVPPGVLCPASTDLGNVSRLLPALQPHMALAGPGLRVHTAGFAPRTVTAEGRRLTVDGAVRLARTAARYLADPDLRGAAAREFREAAPR